MGVCGLKPMLQGKRRSPGLFYALEVVMFPDRDMRDPVSFVRPCQLWHVRKALFDNARQIKEECVAARARAHGGPFSPLSPRSLVSGRRPRGRPPPGAAPT